MRSPRNSAPRTRSPRRLAAAAVALVLAAGGAGVVTVLAVPAGAAGTNLLSNPGFESGNLSGWSCDAGVASVVTSPVHSGSDALAGSPNGSVNAQCTQTVSVQPNTSYTLSGFVQGSYVYLGITGGSSNWTPSASSWQQLSTTFTTAAGQTSVQVFVHGWYAQPTYYADDLALTGPAGPSGSPSPSPSATSASPSPSPSASPSHSPSTSPSAQPEYVAVRIADGVVRWRHVSGEVEAGWKGDSGLLGELGWRGERCAPGARLDPDQ